MVKQWERRWEVHQWPDYYSSLSLHSSSSFISSSSNSSRLFQFKFEFLQGRVSQNIEFQFALKRTCSQSTYERNTGTHKFSSGRKFVQYCVNIAKGSVYTTVAKWNVSNNKTYGANKTFRVNGLFKARLHVKRERTIQTVMTKYRWQTKPDCWQVQ